MGAEKLCSRRCKFRVQEAEQLLKSGHLKIDSILKTKLIRLYLDELEDIEEIKNSHLNHIVDIKETIDSSPEDFYCEHFSHSGSNYVKNLVLMNSSLIIDDLIIDSLAKLHSLEDNNKCLILTNIFLLLQNRTFCRPTLKYIFDNVIYLDSYFYRYGILDSIIKHYSVSDRIVSKNMGKPDDWKLSGDLIGHRDMLEDQSIQKATKLQFIYNDTADLGNDNVMVLSNLIWEEVINYCANDKLNAGSIEKSSLGCDSENVQDSFLETKPTKIAYNLIGQHFTAKNTSCADLTGYSVFTADFREYKSIPALVVEKACILEVFNTIIKNTGNFFYNRIRQNKTIFEQMGDFPVMEKLIEAMAMNFDKFDVLAEEFSHLFLKTKSSRIVKLLEKLKK